MLTQALQWRLLLTQLALLLLLSPALTIWSQAIFALLLLAKLLQLTQESNNWTVTTSNILAIGIVAVFLLMARQLGVIHLMFHLLLLAAMLRLLAFRSSADADAKQLIWVHYFLIACCFILHQNLWLALLIFAVMLLNLHCQYLLFSKSLQPLPWRQFSTATMAILLCCGLLFVFFPRLPPLWQIPGANTAQTGLADEISPGSIEKLVESEQLAFRVTFNGPRPASSELYWRAKVYDRFDGKTWFQKRAYRAVSAQYQAVNTEPTFNFTLIVEPHQQRQLFALARPVEVPPQLRLTSDSLLLRLQPLSQRISYPLQAQLLPVLAVDEADHQLQLPEGNPRSRALALQLQQQPDTAAKIQFIVQLFRQSGYRYTLTPPKLSGDQIDQFLFESQAGFCSHYASASAFLLRAAGVPARLVGGYLSNDWQDNGRYLQVSQRDAHAWVEYLDQGQWLRFDPTAVVAPARLDRQLDQLLSDSDLSLLRQGWLMQGSFSRFLLQRLADLDYYWTSWVLSFDDQKQAGLLQRLQHSWQQIPAGTLPQAMLAITALLLLALLRHFLKRQSNIDPISRLFRPWLQLNPKATAQSYSDYLQQWAAQQPELQPLWQQFQQHYELWVFSNDPTQLQRCQQLSRQLLRLCQRSG